MADDATPSPFDGMPEEFRRMLEQLTGPGGPLEGLQKALGEGGSGEGGLAGLLGGLGGAGGLAGLGGLHGPAGGAGGAARGPVDWRIARQAALQAIGTEDRSASDEERGRAEEALRIAELWLDGSSLPAPPDAGRIQVAARGDWVDAALVAMRPLVEPVAAASTDTMADLARQQMQDLDLEAMGLGPLAGMLGGMDPAQLLRPVGATLAGLQAGQVLGELAGNLLHGTELGIPTGPRSTALFVAPNIAETFGGWELDETEVMVVLALHEAANRRLFHAVAWLESHVHELVATFAEGTEVDVDQLRRMTEELMLGVDPSDPEQLQEAMQSAAQLRLTPTSAQQRVLGRIQGVTALVGAWTRREVAEAAADRLPARARIEEVLHRRRATRADGDQLLASLLGLDITHDDPTLGDDFVRVVVDELGDRGLHEAIGHPENLPDLDELRDPAAWLRRVRGDGDVPDDPAALLDGLGEAPVEDSADDRIAAARAERETTDDPTDDADDADDGDDAGDPDDGDDAGDPDDADDASDPDGGGDADDPDGADDPDDAED